MPANAATPLIRSLRPTDQDDWHRMWTEYLQFYNATVPKAVYASTFARLLGDDPRDFSALVAEVDGKVLGLTHYLFHRHAWRVEDVCYLQDLYVSSDARGLGLGRALIEAVYARADAAGAPAVYWLTQDFNSTARQLYDRIAQVTPFIRYNRKT